MKRLLILPLLALALAAGTALGRGGTAVEAAREAPPPSQADALQYPGADSLNVVNQQCLPDGTVLIQFNWVTYQFGLQWVDLSLHNNGWAWGTFIGIGPFAPSHNSQEWGGLLPGQWHYLRINALTWFGWQPSPTYQFFTRTDCRGQSFDSDGDGIANPFDACPFQYGFPQYQGCPSPVPGPGGPQATMCEQPNGTGWCPGQPAPAQHCGVAFSTQVINPQTGCVWHLKGDGGAYFRGEQLTICYWVSRPMDVRIRTMTPVGWTNWVVEGFDDGRGGCTRVDSSGQALIIGANPGLRTVYMYTGGSLLDTITYNVQ
jgi:hypothetical protein